MGLAAVEDGLVTLRHRTGEVATLSLPEGSELIVGELSVPVGVLRGRTSARD